MAVVGLLAAGEVFAGVAAYVTPLGKKYNISVYTRDVVQTSSGFVIAADGRSWTTILVFAIDSVGEKVWEKEFRGLGIAQARAMVPSGDGGFVVLGYTETAQLTDGGPYVFKIDGKGEVVWERNLSLGGTCIVGSDQTGYTIGVAGFVTRVDASGNEVWLKSYQSAVRPTDVDDIVDTDDGGFLLVGVAETGYGDATSVCLVRLNRDGAKVWETLYNRSMGWTGRAWCAVPSGDGGFVVGGMARPSGGNWDVFVFKVDGGGTFVWEREYGTKEDEECVYDILCSRDGGFVLAGYAEHLGGSMNVYVLKIDGNGNRAWEDSYGGEGRWFGHAVFEGPDNCYTVAADGSLDDAHYLTFLKVCPEMAVPIVGDQTARFILIPLLLGLLGVYELHKDDDRDRGSVPPGR